MDRNPPDPGKYFARIAAHHVQPLWVDTGRYVPRAPEPSYDPAIWRYEDIRPLLFEAGTVITPEEAGRRVLVLKNPALGDFDGTTRSLYACLQLILPGETAAEHRHTQSAIRLVLEGEGAITTVDGTRLAMEPGDFIITPSWAWHGHIHEGATPMVWLDGLDNGLMAQLDTTFFEPGRRESDLLHGSVVAGPQGEGLLRYPYREAREKLFAQSKEIAPDACLGYRMEYLDPLDDAPAMLTMTAALTLLEQGFDGQAYRSSDGTIYTALEGAGETVIDGEVFPWKQHDVFVVPSWSLHSHRASVDSVLFSFSDRVVQRKLGVWREARGG
jgi:gentisate 1,2-dioxygenase